MDAVLFAAEARDKFWDPGPEGIPAWNWAVLIVIILAMLAFDLYRHRDDHEPTGNEALRESTGWVVCGLLFGGWVAYHFGGDAFGEYLSGYLIEKSLSIDNVFVWAILFSTMRIPLKYQHRVLFWGIFGALTLRFLFIVVGATLISRFVWVLVVFGAFLIYTGAKIIRHREDEGEHTKTTGLGLLKRVMPVSKEFDGHNFFTVQNGRRAATPLFAALVVVEFTDVIFAVDSVPAVLAVSHEPYIVFAANAFAILGLRAMYFLLADARQRFHYLSHALGGILMFVGVKMVVSPWYHLNTYASLTAIVAMLVVAMIFSEKKARELGLTGRQLATQHDH